MTPQQKNWEQLASYYVEGRIASRSAKCPYHFNTGPYNAWISGFYAWHKG